jgi:hypothetical protein
MTDIFEERLTEDELYSTLAPPEEGPDPVGELGGAVSDLVQAGGDIAGSFLRPRWPPWGTDRLSEIATTLKDFIGETGKFAPPPEPEELTAEDLLGQIAQGILPAKTGEDKGETAGTDAIKALHFEQMTGEETFVKFINWLRKSGVTMVSREGAGIGMSAIYEAAPGGGLGRVSPAFQGETVKPTANIYNLGSKVGQDKLVGYLQGNWRNTPDLLELIQQNIAENWSTFMSGVVDGKKPQTLETAVSDPNVFGDLMRQFGGYGDGTATLANVDDAFGSGSAQDILGGALEAAIQTYAAELSKGDPSMMIGPDLGEEGGQVGWITSFDGTPYGDIKSVNDLFSGGKLGQLDAYNHMRTLYDNTKDSTGYSPIMDQIQQELFAWGVLDPKQGFEWGKLDIPGMEGMADRTVDALQMFQGDIINEALQVPEGELASDATPYIETVTARLIGRNVNTGKRRGDQTRNFEKSVLENVSRKIQERISSNPHYQRMGQQGVKEVEATIQEMINELGSEERERYFGRGGSALERQLVDSMMSDFYDDSDWGSQVFFGSQNSDMDFINYAKGVGALTDEQMLMLEQGRLSPDNFRQSWETSSVASLQAAERDVVTSNLLKFIANNMTGDNILDDPDALRKGLITFAHTIGQRTASERGYSTTNYADMAMKAINGAQDAPAASPLANTIEERIAESYNLVGGGGGPDFKNLMDRLNNQNRRGTNTLQVRNV